MTPLLWGLLALAFTCTVHLQLTAEGDHEKQQLVPLWWLLALVIILGGN